MGPYCKFCGWRCFVRIPASAPQHIVETYMVKVEKDGLLPLMATCPKGQEYEKALTGYCYDDVKEIVTSWQDGIENAS